MKYWQSPRSKPYKNKRKIGGLYVWSTKIKTWFQNQTLNIWYVCSCSEDPCALPSLMLWLKTEKGNVVGCSVGHGFTYRPIDWCWGNNSVHRSQEGQRSKGWRVRSQNSQTHRDPWVFESLGRCDAFGWIYGQHLIDQIFSLWGHCVPLRRWKLQSKSIITTIPCLFWFYLTIP